MSVQIIVRDKGNFEVTEIEVTSTFPAGHCNHQTIMNKSCSVRCGWKIIFC